MTALQTPRTTIHSRLINRTRIAYITVTILVACLYAGSAGAQPSHGDPSYQLGPEDIVMISVWKDEHLTREVVVRPDGMISFPLIGDVSATGHTVEDLRLEITKRLARYIPNPHVSVSALKLQSYKIYVMGRVNKPGEYLVGHYTDVLQALSLAGGLTPFASENDIKIIRRDTGEGRVFGFRYGDIQKGRDLKQNILLQRGDVVMVP